MKKLVSIVDKIIIILNVIMHGILNLHVLLEYLAFVGIPVLGPNAMMQPIAIFIYMLMCFPYVFIVNLVLFIIAKIIRSKVKFRYICLATLVYLFWAIIPFMI